MKKIFLLWIAVATTTLIGFGQETKTELETRFNVIANETTPGANTKTRIANAYKELSYGIVSVFPVSATGTNTYSGSLLGLEAYSGRFVFVTFANNNTGASTLNLTSIGADDIEKYDGGWVALEADDIVAGKLYRLYHDGTRFQIDLGGGGDFWELTGINTLTGNTEIDGNGHDLHFEDIGSVNLISDNSVLIYGDDSVNIESPIIQLTGVTILPSTTSIGNVSSAELGYSDGVTSSIQAQIDSKQATLVSGTNIKTVNSNSLIGSGNVSVGDALITNSATSLTDGGSITLTTLKHTLTTDEATITFTDSYGGDFLGIEITFNTTTSTWTFPANSLCLFNGVASENNTMVVTGTSGDKIILSRWKVGSNYYYAAANFKQ